MYIKMSGIELTGTLSLSRYWTLKALQLMVPCTDIQLQTCPISLEFTGNGDRYEVSMRGVCIGKKFTAVCLLTRQFTGNKFYIMHIRVTVDGKEKLFTGLDLPDFPKGVKEAIFEVDLPSTI